MRLIFRWQSVTAIVFFALNVDAVVMPGLSWLGCDLPTVVVLGALAGTVEPVYWLWYSEWVAQRVDSSLKQKVLERLLGFITSTHVVMVYPIMAGLGLMPLGWFFAIVVQLKQRPSAPGSFSLFLVVNAFKTAVIGVGFLLMPLPVRVLVPLCILTIAGYRLWRALAVTRDTHYVEQTDFL
jgi:hypothetical protein